MIDSTKNDTFRKLQSLTTSKGLKEEGIFLLSGEKLVREFLQAQSLEIIYEVTHPDLSPVCAGAVQIILSRTLFKEVDVLGTHFNILVLRQPVIEETDAQDTNGVELAVPVGDPGNLGAMIRSAEGFGITRVILTREAAHPFLPKSVKASAGSVLRIKMARAGSLDTLPRHAIALDQGGEDIETFIWPKNALLVVGEEGQGLPKNYFTKTVSIKTQGVESLNAVVAASIAMSRIQK